MISIPLVKHLSKHVVHYGCRGFSKSTTRSSVNTKKIKEVYNTMRNWVDFRSPKYLKTQLGKDFEEVYSIGIENFFIYCYVGGIITAGFTIQPLWNFLCDCIEGNREKVKDFIDQPNRFFTKSNPVEMTWYHMAGIALFITLNVVAAVICVRTAPMRIYYSEAKNEFCFAFQGKMPLQKKLVSCKPGEVANVSVDNPPYLMPWKRYEHTFQGKKIFISDQHFKLPSYYNILCGYQKVKQR